MASATVGAGGGTVGQSGFSLQFPSGSFASGTPVSVAQAAIVSQSFGKLITPITPLYQVDTGGSEPREPVTVVMPMKVPSGSTPMAFSYDDATGTVTPLAPQRHDASSMTVVATHFSGMFGALLDSSMMPTFTDSGFRPGQDDWEFTNFGSYVAAGGHCDGQSISALWYYTEQQVKAHAPRLYGTFDNNGVSPKTPDLWEDDSFGYRFASTVQTDTYANPFTVNYFANVLESPDGRSTYATFQAAIETSGEPQLVWIGSEERHLAHAMIVYAVESDGLLIADPNYPGERRVIPYDAATGALGPYFTGENAALIAASGEHAYTRFAYIPWRSRASEDRLAELWTDFKEGKIGNAVFPMAGIEVLQTGPNDAAGQWVPLTDGYQTTLPSLRFRVTTESTNVGQGGFRVYDGSTQIKNLQFESTVDLQPGDHELGFALWASAWDGERWSWSYVDFQHFTVTVGSADVQVTVKPTTITDPSAFHTLVLDLSDIPPTITSFKTVVDWGDGRAPQIAPNGRPQSDGTAHVVVTEIYAPPNGGKDVSQITVSFQDANGVPLAKWPRVTIPVVQPSGAPTFA
ncbi:MAG TPA: hypothetical protein VF395_11905, partial [Polyangiaceae bacterium]